VTAMNAPSIFKFREGEYGRGRIDRAQQPLKVLASNNGW